MARPGEGGYDLKPELAEDRIHWHVIIQAGSLRSVEVDRWEGEKQCECIRIIALVQVYYSVGGSYVFVTPRV